MYERTAFSSMVKSPSPRCDLTLNTQIFVLMTEDYNGEKKLCPMVLGSEQTKSGLLPH